MNQFNNDYDFDKILKQYRTQAQKLQNPGGTVQPANGLEPQDDENAKILKIYQEQAKKLKNTAVPTEEMQINNALNNNTVTKKNNFTAGNAYGTNNAAYTGISNGKPNYGVNNNTGNAANEDVIRKFVTDSLNSPNLIANNPTPYNAQPSTGSNGSYGDMLDDWGTDYRGKGQAINMINPDTLNANDRNLFIQDRFLYNEYMRRLNDNNAYKDKLFQSYDSEKQQAYIKQKQNEKTLMEYLKATGVYNPELSESAILNSSRDMSNALGQIDSKYTNLRNEAKTSFSNAYYSSQQQADSNYSDYSNVVQEDKQNQAIFDTLDKVENSSDLSQLDSYGSDLETLFNSGSINQATKNSLLNEIKVKQKEVASVELESLLDSILGSDQRDYNILNGKYDYYTYKKVKDFWDQKGKYLQGDAKTQQNIKDILSSSQQSIGEYLKSIGVNTGGWAGDSRFLGMAENMAFAWKSKGATNAEIQSMLNQLDLKSDVHNVQSVKENAEESGTISVADKLKIKKWRDAGMSDEEIRKILGRYM